MNLVRDFGFDLVDGSLFWVGWVVLVGVWFNGLWLAVVFSMTLLMDCLLTVCGFTVLVTVGGFDTFVGWVGFVCCFFWLLVGVLCGVFFRVCLVVFACGLIII